MIDRGNALPLVAKGAVMDLEARVIHPLSDEHLPQAVQQTQRWLAAGCFEALVGELRAVLCLAIGRKAAAVRATILNGSGGTVETKVFVTNASRHRGLRRLW